MCGHFIIANVLVSYSVIIPPRVTVQARRSPQLSTHRAGKVAEKAGGTYLSCRAAQSQGMQDGNSCFSRHKVKTTKEMEGYRHTVREKIIEYTLVHDNCSYLVTNNTTLLP